MSMSVRINRRKKQAVSSSHETKQQRHDGNELSSSARIKKYMKIIVVISFISPCLMSLLVIFEYLNQDVKFAHFSQ